MAKTKYSDNVLLYMKENEEWFKESIKNLTKAYKNRLRVNRIQKIVRLFNIDTKF